MVTAGAPITIAASDTAQQLSAVHKLVNKVLIQPRFDNGGVLFVGDSTLKPSINTGVFRQLETPSATAIPIFEFTEADSPNGVDLFNFWVASTQISDVVYWSYNER